MQIHQTFRSLPVGTLFVTQTDGYVDFDTPNPHSVRCKVDARHYQAGTKYPSHKEIVLPPEGAKLKEHDPNLHIIRVPDDPSFTTVRR